MAAREAAAGDVAVQRDVLRLESRSLEVLAEVLGDARPTFAVVLGDQEAILPGRNRLLPFSLNAWVQAFVQLRNRTASVPWRLVTMDAWKRASEQASEAADSSEPGGEIDPWNLVADGKDPLKQGSGDDGAMRFAMTPAEGVEVWRRLLVASDMDQIVVSTGDLELRLRGGEEEEGSARPSSLHARPAIQQEYVGPRDELERLVVQVWEDVLGIGDVGIFDEFFELGGNSLLATQLVSRLRALFQVELPLRELLELRTVAGIAAALKEREAEVTGEDDLDRLLEELEGMPEEEAAQIASIGT